MQYLGHKKLTTTQKYLKNVYLEDDEVKKLMDGMICIKTRSTDNKSSTKKRKRRAKTPEKHL